MNKRSEACQWNLSNDNLTHYSVVSSMSYFSVLVVYPEPFLLIPSLFSILPLAYSASW